MVGRAANPAQRPPGSPRSRKEFGKTPNLKSQAAAPSPTRQVEAQQLNTPPNQANPTSEAGAPQPTEAQAQSNTQPAEIKTITAPMIADLETALKKYFEENEDPILNSMGENIALAHKGDILIELKLPYATALSAVEAEKKTIVEFCKSNLGVSKLNLEIAVAETKVVAVEVLSNREKFEKLAQENPAMIALAERLGLDIIN